MYLYRCTTDSTEYHQWFQLSALRTNLIYITRRDSVLDTIKTYSFFGKSQSFDSRRRRRWRNRVIGSTEYYDIEAGADSSPLSLNFSVIGDLTRSIKTTWMAFEDEVLEADLAIRTGKPKFNLILGWEKDEYCF